LALRAVGEPVPDGDEAAVLAVVANLDEAAWIIPEDERALRADYAAAFRRARAVNAHALAKFGGEPDDAVYEALHALDAPSDAAFVLGL
jgi:hypothetical protein